MKVFKKKYFIAIFFVIKCISAIYSQEAIHSEHDMYFDYQALLGEASRPYLNYKTLSDSTWTDDKPLKIFGLDFFSSYNSTDPYGMDDGALWQGRGLNLSVSTGIRFSSYGIEATFKPQFYFSQNMDFDIMPSGSGEGFGYFWPASGKSADAPQRFGDDSVWGFSWGDSEIRYIWHGLTVGFGTQLPWLGPGRKASIMHSNNAAPYPKFDIGIRKTSLALFGYELGFVEARMWAGRLTESDYFDDIEANDHNLISALAVAFSPSLLPGLTLFANRSYLAPWVAESANSLLSLLFVDINGNGADDVWDQRASLGFDYLLPQAGIEVYGEIGVNDYARNKTGYLRYPFHSMVYLGGLRKSFSVPFLQNLKGELLGEWMNMEVSQDFQFQYPSSFYMHYQIIQGYTNEGQWLGSGLGTGGNSQYLGVKLYEGPNNYEFYLHRYNPDNDFIYAYTITNGGTFDPDLILRFKTVFACGINVTRQLSSSLKFTGGASYVFVDNPLYQYDTGAHNGFRLETKLYWDL